MAHIEMLESRTLFAAAAAHRILPAGSVDPRFVPPLANVSVQSNGRGLLFSTYGASQGQSKNTITADRPDGTPDTRFNQNVAASLPAGFNVTDFQIETNDQIVVCGVVGFATDVLRLDSDGTLDTSFGVNAIATIPSASDASDIVNDNIGRVRLEADGRIVLENQDDLVRLTTAGTLDPTFGTGGVLQFTNSLDPLVAQGLAVQSDGKILLSAYFPRDAAHTQVPVVIRFNVDGTGDMAFGVGGQATLTPTPKGWDVWTRGLVVLPNDKIDLYLNYDSGNYNGPERSVGYVEQLKPDGAVNLRFGNHGRADVALLSGGHHVAGSMLVDPSGNIIVASVQEFGYPVGGGVGFAIQYATDYGGVLRLTPAGQRDPTFGHLGVRILNAGRTDQNPGEADAWFYPSNGDIVVGVDILGYRSTTDALLDSPLRV